MKKLLLAGGITGLATLAALADFSTTFTSGFQNSGNIPDGSTIGLADSRTLTGIPFNSIADVNVRLNISGGWNGDLYAYLTHSSGFTVLLNRVGRSGTSSFGYGNSGMNVTFDEQAGQTADFHFYQTVAGFNAAMLQGGTGWRPDGRNVSPLSSGATIAAASRTALLDSFYRLDPNGTWTLYLADLSGGGGQPTLQSWGLDIVATVPEPASIVEGSVAVLFLGSIALLYRARKM
jgi:subtilisin-like proprotein convertase family protein